MVSEAGGSESGQIKTKKRDGNIIAMKDKKRPQKSAQANNPGSFENPKFSKSIRGLEEATSGRKEPNQDFGCCGPSPLRAPNCALI